MKRIIALLLAAVLMLALCSCSVVSIDDADSKDADETLDTATIRSNFDSASAYIESIIGKTDMTTSIQDDNDGQELYKYWGYEDYVGEDVIPMEIAFAGVTVTIGETTVKELKDMGANVSYDEDTVEPYSTGSVSVEKDGKTISLFTEQNDADEAKPIEDMRIYGFWCGTDEWFMPFDYAGVKPGATLKDVIDILGVPLYTIRLESSDFNTSIDLSYSHNVKEGNVETSDSLSVYLIYDPETGEATLGSMQLERNINVYDEEE